MHFLKRIIKNEIAFLDVCRLKITRNADAWFMGRGDNPRVGCLGSDIPSISLTSSFHRIIIIDAQY